MTVERNKHYLTTEQYSVLTGWKNEKTMNQNRAKRQRLTPKRPNFVEGTKTDPSWRDILKELTQDIKEQFLE